MRDAREVPGAALKGPHVTVARRGFARVAVSVAVLVATGFSLSGCVTACPAIAHLYSGPAVLQFSEPVPATATVAACFGEACAPIELPRNDDRRWEVPQEVPFLGVDAVGDGWVRTVRVVATDRSGKIISDKAHEIPVAVERTGLFGQCNGPFEFEDVPITIPG